jgi:hypothetical protein
MTKRYCTEEEVKHTVEVTFFQCIKRYEKKDSEKGPIPFSAFLYSYFFYLLKKMFKYKCNYGLVLKFMAIYILPTMLIRIIIKTNNLCVEENEKRTYI